MATAPAAASSAYQSLPAAMGNRGARYRLATTIPEGPRRLTDGGERPRFHAARGARPGRRRIGRAELAAAGNILVVKLDLIGDWVLTTPFLAALRRSAPRAKITAVVLDRVFDLATACADVDRVVSVARAERDRVWFGAGTVGDLAGFRRDYRGGAFDLALVPRWDADFNGALKVAWGSGAPVVGFSEGCTPRKAILNRGDDGFYRRAVLDRRPLHEGERNLALIAAMGGAGGSRWSRITPSPADFAAADHFLGAALGQGHRPFVAVAPFVRDGRRQLPLATMQDVLARLRRRFHLDAVVVASPDEAPAAQDFARRLGAGAASAAGSLGLRATAALISRAALFVGLDSGPAHVAGGVGTPAVVIFGHPRDGSPADVGAPERFAPWTDPARLLVVQPDNALPPCSGGCRAVEPHCILQLDAERIFAEVAPFAQRHLSG